MKDDILTHVAVRQILAKVAKITARLEKDEFERLRRRIIEELTQLVPGGEFTELWRQATEGLDGPESYGLERIGLWPTKEN